MAIDLVLESTLALVFGAARAINVVLVVGILVAGAVIVFTVLTFDNDARSNRVVGDGIVVFVIDVSVAVVADSGDVVIEVNTSLVGECNCLITFVFGDDFDDALEIVEKL